VLPVSSPGGLVAVAAGTVAVAWLVTDAARRFALARAILDVPNARSAHSRPTPRGGGIGIVVAVLAAWVAAGALGWVGWRLIIGVGGGGAAVALIGWLDDRKGLGQLPRLAVQVAASLWCLYWALPAVLSASPWWPAVAVGVIVWGTNLYNFMDGIDGLAGSEALVVAAAAAGFSYVAGASEMAIVSTAVAGAATGFLRWNWSPARVFMGDVGSGFLGFTLAALAVISPSLGGPPHSVWAILLAVFWFDATVTLIRRVLGREPWYQPHRSHAYQRAALGGVGHRATALAIVGLNLVLAFIAAAVASSTVAGWVGCMAAVLVVGAAFLWVERKWPKRS
jgi:Fuc2NAc and GlcNAc transferase